MVMLILKIYVNISPVNFNFYSPERVSFNWLFFYFFVMENKPFFLKHFKV